MKYRDLVTLFVAIFFFLSLAYTLGVDHSISVWPVTVVLFIILVLIVYKLWIEK